MVRYSLLVTIVRKLNKLKKPVAHLLSKSIVVPVILLIGGLLLSSSVRPKTVEATLGGPESAEDIASMSANSDTAVLASDASLDELTDESTYDTGIAGFVVLNDAMALDSGAVFGPDAASRDGILVYRVEKGDTLSSIAAKFNIDAATIFGANKSVSATLREGQDLTILPVKGVMVSVADGDTISGLALKYGVSGQAIFAANTIDGALVIGQKLIIPGGKTANAPVASTSKRSRLPAWPASIPFTPPTTGYNWHIAHGPNMNAVDIANDKGTVIVAAAAGTISFAQYGWNGGYGNEIRIDHGQGVITIYGHLESISVTEGQYVERGQLLGIMGNTGKIHASAGGTGRHLHFDVLSARNPLL